MGVKEGGQLVATNIAKSNRLSERTSSSHQVLAKRIGEVQGVAGPHASLGAAGPQSTTVWGLTKVRAGAQT